MNDLFSPDTIPSVKKYKLQTLDTFRIFLYIVFGILTLGVFWIIAYWTKELKYFLYSDSDNIWDADCILFYRHDGLKFLRPIERKKCRISPYQNSKHFLVVEYEGQLFYFDVQQKIFHPVKDQIISYILKNPNKNDEILQGLNLDQVKDLKNFYGYNLMKIEIISFFIKFLEEFFSPILFTQVIIVFLLTLINRYIYAFCVFLYILITILLRTWEYRSNREKLKEISQSNEQSLRVKRKIDNQEEILIVNVKNLVIGDIVELEQNLIFPCDLLLVEGTCLVNEALLTGESLPILKQSFSIKDNDKKHIQKSYLYGGTKLIHQKSQICQGIVVGTGWNTRKGQLLGSVLYAQEEKDQFNVDFIKVLLIQSLFHIACFIVLIILDLQKEKTSFKYTFSKSIDIIKQFFPPSLIFIMTASVQISSNKLSQQKIFSLKTNKIVEAGAVDTVCFDKTGTLTELEILIFGYILRYGKNFDQFSNDIKNFKDNKEFQNFIKLISICHSLEEVNGEIQGDPIEIVMFEAAEAKLGQQLNPYNKNQGVNNINLKNEYKQLFGLDEKQKFVCIKIIDFNSDRKRMSVIVEDNITKKQQLFCKGAPEMIKNLCTQESIPDNYDQQLDEFSKQGYRVLAISYKDFNQSIFNSNMNEEQLEIQQIFLGFILFENPLKKQSKNSIKELQKCQVETNMITGDNINTAINVGYDVGILNEDDNLWIGKLVQNKIEWTYQNSEKRIKKKDFDTESLVSSIVPSKIAKSKLKLEHVINECIQNRYKKIALEGSAFQKIIQILKDQPNVIEQILEQTFIYARASSEQKKLIVDQIKIKNQKKQTYVGFVGDGSNDTMALKAANVGLSIGNDESSFSASFYTSRMDISTIIDVLIEGKVCLGNAFQNFKFYMTIVMLGSFVFVVISLYSWDYTTFDYIASLIYGFPIAYFMSLSERNKKLTFINQPPTLFDRELLISLFFYLFCVQICFVICIVFLASSNYYKPFDHIVGNFMQHGFSFDDHFFVEPRVMESLFMTANIFIAFVHYQGAPFKRPIYCLWRFYFS